MDKQLNVAFVGVAFLGVILSRTPVIMAYSTGEAIRMVADRLEADQVRKGSTAGIWPNEADFTGSIVAGMVRAYELTCESAYKSSAELGGSYILRSAQGNFYGDEAFALTCLSDISSDPCNNPWQKAVKDFYSNVEGSVGTKSYIAQFASAEASTAVFYLANHVVAAYYVNAKDKQLWRQGLIDRLAQVDDSSNFPVMGLGVAVWALSQSGPLDKMFVDPSTKGKPYWKLVTLAELPGLLLSHQVPVGEPNAGSFYWRFDHSDGGTDSYACRYAEDTIFGTLGLIASGRANPDLDLDAAIFAARQALLGGIDSEGKVYEHLSRQGEVHYAYAGEMLQALSGLAIPGDIDLSGSVDFVDLAIFADSWHTANCTACSWCNGGDLDRDTKVGCPDLAIIANNWLRGASH